MNIFIPVSVAHFNGVKLVVTTPEDALFGYRGGNITLPCSFHYEPKLSAPRRFRVKWSKLHKDNTKEKDVLVAIGLRHRSFGEYKGRVHLLQSAPHGVSLVITDLRLEDHGKYKCEIIDGLEDESGIVELELRGEELGIRFFHYSPPWPRSLSTIGALYSLIFFCT